MPLQDTALPSSMPDAVPDLFQVQTKKLKVKFLELFAICPQLYPTPEHSNLNLE